MKISDSIFLLSNIMIILAFSFFLFNIVLTPKFEKIERNQKVIQQSLEEIKAVQYDMLDMLGDIPCDSIN